MHGPNASIVTSDPSPGSHRRLGRRATTAIGILVGAGAIGLTLASSGGVADIADALGSVSPTWMWPSIWVPF